MAAVGENVGSGAGLELGGLGPFIICLKTCTNKTFAQKIFLMIGAWRPRIFWVQENIFGCHIIEKSGIERLLF